MKRDTDDLIDLISIHADRLGSSDPFTATQNILEFARVVGEIESDGRLDAINIPQEGKEQTSAKGLYQFVDNSVSPAVNRVTTRIPKRDWMDVKDVRDLSVEQQTTLFLGDLLEKTAMVDGKKVPGLGDKLMKGVMDGDVDSMIEAYEVLHHTAPDEATKERTHAKFQNLR